MCLFKDVMQLQDAVQQAHFLKVMRNNKMCYIMK